MRAMMALALTGLCLLAMMTVRLRNAEMLRGYRIAVLERKERQMSNLLMTLEAEVARKTSTAHVLKRAAEMGILNGVTGFESLVEELVPPENVVPAGQPPVASESRDAFIE